MMLRPITGPLVRPLTRRVAGPLTAINNIGRPGAPGYGVGVCPALPAGYTPLPGYTNPLSPNYGNYQYSDGSVMCWIPAFYLRLGHVDNPTYPVHGVNSVDTRPLAAFASEAEANALGYYLHRAFVNGGANQLGCFRDKYDCSNNGGIASSIRNAMPMVSGPQTGQSGFNTLTGAPVNSHYGSIAAAKTRGAKFFPETVFIADALARISEAHAQASASSVYCAWYDAAGTTNFPKGNNNNALKDTNDTSVTFTSAGASAQPNMALTGSGVPFAKTTHNGQACGVSDVNGNIWKINLGLTCLATSKSITAAAKANPVALTVTGHGLTTGQTVRVTSVGGMTEINDKLFIVTVVDSNTITLDGVNGTAFAAYTSGGTVTSGAFHLLKASVDVAALTDGQTLATDHWGAVGVAAQFDPLSLNFGTTYSSNIFGQRFGLGANQVFAWGTAPERALSMAGMPAGGGMSTSGTNAMGADYYFQYIRDMLCVISRGNWSYGSYSGCRARALSHARTDAHYNVGFAAASYL